MNLKNEERKMKADELPTGKYNSFESASLACDYIREITDLADLYSIKDTFDAQKKWLRSEQIREKKNTLSIGDAVSFEDKEENTVIGELIKINRTKAQVSVDKIKDEEGSDIKTIGKVTWTVPIVMLEKVI
jgi:hypothetical protein